jgi:type I site-specific restriction endonuclease
MPNQNPEQQARDQIDAQIRASGWVIQNANAFDLRECQVTSITGLDTSVKKAKPRSLVQMATGSGKTFTAITFIYRLLKHARIKRVLFLVDTTRRSPSSTSTSSSSMNATARSTTSSGR